MLAAQTVCLSWLANRVGSRAASDGAASDRGASGPPPRPEAPVQVGERARFKQLLVFEAGDAQRDDTARQVYDELLKAIARQVDVEAGADGSDVAMVPSGELAAGNNAAVAGADEAIVVFRSHDDAWAGFRFGGNSFRFRHGAMTEVWLTVMHPAKGGGGYDVTLSFDVPRKAVPRGADDPIYASGDCHFWQEYSDSHSRGLAYVFREIAHMLDAKFRVDEFMNV